MALLKCTDHLFKIACLIVLLSFPLPVMAAVVDTPSVSGSITCTYRENQPVTEIKYLARMLANNHIIIMYTNVIVESISED